MAKSFAQIIFLFFLTKIALFSQIIAPASDDSIIAGKEISFRFSIKSKSLQYLEYSIDSENWIEIGKFANRYEFEWMPPYVDIDSIYFRYEAHNFTTPEKLWQIEHCHSGEITSIDFWNGDSIMLSSSLDGNLYLWDLNNLAKIDSLRTLGKIFSAKFFLSGTKVIYCSDTSVYFYDFSNPSSYRKVWEGNSLIRALDVHNRKLLGAFGTYSGEIVIFDTTFNLLKTILTGRQIYSIAFSNSGDLLAIGDYNGFVAIYSVETGDMLFEFSTNKDSTFQNVVWSVSFCENDSLLVAGGIDGKTRIFNLFNQNLEYVFPSHSFHIRGTAFCLYAPVVMSVSLDSTLYQIFYPLNFTVHNPIKESSAITFLKPIYGGRYFFLGLRNGTIAFYKNFEYEHIEQTLALPYYIPVLAKCQSFQSFAGRMTSFPIVLRNIHEVPLNRFFRDSSFAILEVPAEHFGVFHPENNRLKYGTPDTIYSVIQTIGYQDTFAVVQAYTLHPWGERKAVFRINQVDFRGKKNIYWILDTSTVEIVEPCKPLTNLMKFELIPKFDFEVNDNPISEQLKVLVSSDSTFFCKFVLINLVSGKRYILFEGEIESGNRMLFFDVKNVASGPYYLLMENEFTNLAKKLIIAH